MAKHGCAILRNALGQRSGQNAGEHWVLRPAARGACGAWIGEQIQARGQPEMDAELLHFAANGPANGPADIRRERGGEQRGRRKGRGILPADDLIVLAADLFCQAKPFRTGGKLHRRDAVTLERGGCAQCAGPRRRAEAELVDELP